MRSGILRGWMQDILHEASLSKLLCYWRVLYSSPVRLARLLDTIGAGADPDFAREVGFLFHRTLVTRSDALVPSSVLVTTSKALVTRSDSNLINTK